MWLILMDVFQLRLILSCNCICLPNSCDHLIMVFTTENLMFSVNE